MPAAAPRADSRRVSQGFFSLWSKARNVFNKYLSPVDEACSGLFPPMVQKILVINVPRIFAPFWSVISMVLPEQHKVPPPGARARWCRRLPALAIAYPRAGAYCAHHDEQDDARRAEQIHAGGAHTAARDG